MLDSSLSGPFPRPVWIHDLPRPVWIHDHASSLSSNQPSLWGLRNTQEPGHIKVAIILTDGRTSRQSDRCIWQASAQIRIVFQNLSQKICSHISKILGSYSQGIYFVFVWTLHLSPVCFTPITQIYTDVNHIFKMEFWIILSIALCVEMLGHEISHEEDNTWL